MPLPPEIVDEANRLFDDVRVEAIDPARHMPFVIERVLDRGTSRSVAALVRMVGEDGLRKFFRAGGARRLSPRTVPLWRAYLGLSELECTPRSSPQRSSPFWRP